MPLVDLPFAVLVRLDLGPGCWNWTGNTDKDGYGLVPFSPRSRVGSQRAHKWMYEQLVGPVGMLDHTCHNRRCVRPDHLLPTTPKGNAETSTQARGLHNSRKTHCSNGHPFDVIMKDGKNLSRSCRICRRRWQKEYEVRHSGRMV